MFLNFGTSTSGKVCGQRTEIGSVFLLLCFFIDLKKKGTLWMAGSRFKILPCCRNANTKPNSRPWPSQYPGGQNSETKTKQGTWLNVVHLGRMKKNKINRWSRSSQCSRVNRDRHCSEPSFPNSQLHRS